jgi:hypothetical protein
MGFVVGMYLEARKIFKIYFLLCVEKVKKGVTFASLFGRNGIEKEKCMGKASGVRLFHKSR